ERVIRRRFAFGEASNGDQRRAFKLADAFLVEAPLQGLLFELVVLDGLRDANRSVVREAPLAVAHPVILPRVLEGTAQRRCRVDARDTVSLKPAQLLDLAETENVEPHLVPDRLANRGQRALNLVESQRRGATEREVVVAHRDQLAGSRSHTAG